MKTRQNAGEVLGGRTRVDVRLLHPELGQTNPCPTRAGGTDGGRVDALSSLICSIFSRLGGAGAGGGGCNWCGNGINWWHW